MTHKHIDYSWIVSKSKKGYRLNLKDWLESLNWFAASLDEIGQLKWLSDEQ